MPTRQRFSQLTRSPGQKVTPGCQNKPGFTELILYTLYIQSEPDLSAFAIAQWTLFSFYMQLITTDDKIDFSKSNNLFQFSGR